MQRLVITLSFDVENRAQAKFILKRVNKVRHLASKTLLCKASRMTSNIDKI